MKLFFTGALAGLACGQFAAAASSSSSSGTTCNAVVIGALGSQQSYVAGALSALAAAGAEYDVVVSTGASVLAAQAAAAGSSSKQWATAAVSAMKGLSASDMFTDWDGGKVTGLTTYGGLYNASASASVYAGILGASGAGANSRKVVSVAVSLTSTLQVPLPVSTSDVQQSVAGLVASAADPTTFAAYPASFDGAPDLFVSGETRGQVNVFEAVAQCRALGAADADITVDVVYTTASSLKDRDVSHDNTLLVMLRDSNIKKYIAAQQDVLFAKWAYPDVNFRYDVSPSFQLLTDPTDYSSLNRLGMIARGTSDAKAEIKRVQAGKECDTSTAPSCSQDQDCVVWAAKSCFSAALAKSGRCLAPSSSSDAASQCSFNATEIAEHRAARVTRSEADGACIGAAFSGGGDRGAYEAGVLKGLAGSAPAGTLAYQIASGVSVGSIVSSGLSMFPIGQEVAAADFAVSTALGVTSEVIFKNWSNLVPFIGPGGMLRGLTIESGLYDSSGERNFLKTKFPNTPVDPSESYRTHSLLATDMGTGQGKTFEFVGSQGTPQLIDALMASSAIQGAFPMVDIDGVHYGDGGAVSTIDVYTAVDLCRAAGFDTSNIHIDTISVAGYAQTVLPPGVVFYLNSTQIAARVQVMQAIDSLMAVVDFYRTAEPQLFRLNLYPSTQLPGTGLEFNVTQMQQMVTIGEGDGKAAAGSLAEGTGTAASTCAYKTAKVACGSDKDCFNWGVEKCSSRLSSTVCDHTARQCVFSA